ncbi:MAG: phospho-N-acetylmuramoyl-pentapeptide transferase, partial [Parcubacteria group bacterium Gr01-1014_106]
IKDNWLTKKQAEFWNTVYTKGLGEFFYKNKIDFRNRVQFPYVLNARAHSVAFPRANASLLLFGGGKDSIVSGEMLRRAKKRFSAFSVNEADGLDGLAGGILLFCFGAFGVIAYVKGLTDLAVFCAVIIGSLLAFLWFNVFPARFFMGDTGSMSLGITLGIIAMLTNSALVLPIIAFPLVLESLSVIVQVLSKKLRGKKLFLSTPIHHHFEAIGWPETKVTMRMWILAAVCASLGTILGLLGAGKLS